MSRLDLCPRCGGILDVTTLTNSTWRARCYQCRRYSHLDDQFEWVAGYGWGAWVYFGFLVLTFILVAYLEANGWA